MPEFVHLHSHTQFSLLDGASNIDVLMQKAAADGMKGVALTDHGNMFGAFKFVAAAEKHNIKPIVGCEFYLVEDRFKRSFAKAKGERDKRYHQLMLAKNQTGYENLCKLCSYGFMEGLYSKFPRIDKTLILKHHEGLIATTCCIGAEIPQAIVRGDLEKAEELLKWWLNIFGEDFYIEIQRHRGLDNLDVFKNGKRVLSGVSQEQVNQVLLGFAQKYKVKVIATNDAHYVEEEDWEAHDMLLCINTGSIVEDENRFRFSSSDFYFKSQNEMNQLFSDVPESIANTIEIYDKIDTLSLARDILLPAFPLPKEYNTQDDYLRGLTYQGAKRRYGTLTPDITERLDFELGVIRNSGYPGYFLIVQDFTTEARNMGVSVGPGRGSAAGSAVAYCLGITNIDPIKYDLLFERFLNPERVSMPDIDIDFDDVGRSKVMDYVLEKYGRNQVAQIITYGSMAARSSLQDVGRVMNIPLSEVIQVKKVLPENLSVTLKKILAEGDIDPKLKGKLNSEEVEQAYQFRKLSEDSGEIGTMIENARKLEGSIRNTGIHACGVIITPDDITNYVPVSVAKDSDLLVSQFDNSVAEDAGLLKMDFLGLKTLTIIKDACKIVKATEGIDIIPDEIPLDDVKTYELFQRGETIGVFQYESAGMQKYMRELVPSKFADLIAMNALYRPGPIAYIPLFIDRKHGRAPIQFDLEDMKEYLDETYGITVYQEQVMLLSQKLANFSKGQADMLRKAMGKKKKKLIDQMWPIFRDGCAKNGHNDEKIVEKIWKDWEAFASYAFNKSHSTCYAFVAFQTAYLKANHPAAFMASVLTHNKSDISKVNFFLQECRNQNIEVLGPDINESFMNFSVNKEGKIRFGLSALKGVGEGPVEEIIRTKKEQGEPYKNIFDLVKKINLKVANKRCFESLVLGGAFDAFGLDRSVYFTLIDGKLTFLEQILRYGNNYQKQKSELAFSLFGAGAVDETMPPPKIPTELIEWSLIEKLKKEKEVTGIYLSGHPLDDYRLEIAKFTKTINRLDEFKGQEVAVAGIVTSINHRVGKKGNLFGYTGLEDYEGTLMEFGLFGDTYLKYRHLLEVDTVLYVKGKYQQSWRDDTVFELRINEIQLLDEVGNKKIKGIAVSIPIQLLTHQLIDNLDQVCQKHQGEQQFSVNILDVSQKIVLQLDSKNKRINADSLFIASIEQLGLSYKMLS
jgi:DNA polymerase-3 subunit alpha